MIWSFLGTTFGKIVAGIVITGVVVGGAYGGAYISKFVKKTQQVSHEREVKKENLKHLKKRCAYSFEKECP